MCCRLQRLDEIESVLVLEIRKANLVDLISVHTKGKIRINSENSEIPKQTHNFGKIKKKVYIKSDLGIYENDEQLFIDKGIYSSCHNITY